MDNYVCLHTHSHYSDGSSKVEELVEKAASLGQPALAITDHGTMAGCIDLYKACKRFGIKPIIGNEMYLEHPLSDVLKEKDVSHLTGDYKPGNRFHQIVLAKDLTGYKNLSRLTTWSELENKKAANNKGKAYPLITLEKLKEHHEGLIVTTGCIGSLVPQLIIFNEIELAEQVLLEYLSVFKDDYYIELQYHDQQEIYLNLNNVLVNLANKYNIKCIISPDTHYLTPEHYKIHNVLYAIKYGKKLSELVNQKFSYDKDLFFGSSDELKQRFANTLPEYVINEAINNTVELSEKIQHYELFRKPTAPNYEPPNNHTQESYLRQLAADGLTKLFVNQSVPQEYIDRIDYELEVINRMGFASYFLIVIDYITWAENNDIMVGPGRGSVAGSLVAYTTGITKVNPLKYKLSFERFLNPDRASMPDIDVDFDVDGRQKVINYISEKYGKKRVSQIITSSTLTSKAAIRSVATVLGIGFADALNISNMIPVNRGKSEELTKMISHDTPSPEFKRMYETDPNFKDWIDIALKLEGCIRGYGVHAAGVVIGDVDIEEYCPLMLSKNNQVCTQYEMSTVEELGFIKMDFLGLNNLSIISDALKSISDNIDINNIPLDDSQAYTVFASGNTEGIFQFESPGMQDVLKQLRPSSIEDLAVANALYRPGALDSGMIPEYIARKHNRKEVVYDFPELQEVLNDTFGILVFQESVMRASQVIAGFSATRADELRKVVGKKLVHKMVKEREEFVEGAVERGYSPLLVSRFFDKIETFGSYGFNKSHSVAYSLIAYQCAYLKVHYKCEFMAALLSRQNDNTKVAKYLNSARQLGIQILPPSINNSDYSFKSETETNSIYFGFKAIKGLGESSIDLIINERNKKPFSSILDFCERTNIDTSGLTSLILCGSLDDFGYSRKDLVNNIPKIKKFINDKKKATTELVQLNTELNELLKDEETNSKIIKRRRKSIQTREQKLLVNFDDLFTCFNEEYDVVEILKNEYELVGHFVSSNPVSLLPQYELFPVDSVNKKYLVVAANILEKEFRVSKNGNNYLSCKFEDTKGTIVSGLIFSKLLNENLDTLKSALAIVGKFNVSIEDESIKAICNEILEVF
jgi:DNA polymerase-3 subunit alpha